jgi:NitT/TauT family transport system substrate-binding protein
MRPCIRVTDAEEFGAVKRRMDARWIAALAISGLVFAACGGSTPTASPTEATPTEAAATATAPAGEVPAPEQTTLKIGLSVTETSQYAAMLASQLDIYKKYGFTDVQITVFEGDGKSMQALQAEQLDIAFVGVSSAITSQTTDAPVSVLSVNAKILTDEFVSTADVKSAADLKGKCVAISTFGGTSNGSVLLSLQALGLSTSDVVITEIGGQSARIASLQGGSCAAAPVDAAKHADMAALGFNFLVDLKSSGQEWGRSGAAVRKDWLATHPNTALAFEAALLEAQNSMWADPDTAAAKYAEFAQIDLDAAKALIADFQEIGNRTMMWDDATFENPKKVLATVNPDIAGVPVADAYDKSVLDTLNALGVYAKLGVPLN